MTNAERIALAGFELIQQAEVTRVDTQTVDVRVPFPVYDALMSQVCDSYPEDPDNYIPLETVRVDRGGQR